MTIRTTGMKLAMAAAILAACAQPDAPPAQAAPVPEPTPGTDRAVAVLHPTEGSSVSGLVRFEAHPDGVLVSVRVQGLTPGNHGFHVHEFGDCSRPDGTAAGGHFNPLDEPHAAREAHARHVGDLGNVTADEEGGVETEYVDPMLGFAGAASILGRGVIVHADEDDLTTQPTGAAGGRVACGVVGVAAPVGE